MSGRCDTCGEAGLVWCGECLGPHPADAIATRENLRAENARLQALVSEQAREIARLVEAGERYERALYGPVPMGGMETLSGNECRLCCADAKPEEIDMHEDDCPLRRAALAAASEDGGA